MDKQKVIKHTMLILNKVILNFLPSAKVVIKHTMLILNPTKKNFFNRAKHVIKHTMLILNLHHFSYRLSFNCYKTYNVNS